MNKKDETKDNVKNSDEETQVVKKDSALPSRISGNKPAGFEEMDMQQDIILPRVQILQGLSEIVSEGKGIAGELADSLSKEIYGETFDFIPLFLFKTKVMFEVGKGLTMYSRNGLTITTASEEYQEYVGKNCEEVPFNAWQGNTPPGLALVYNFPSLRVGRLTEFPISVSLMKASTKAAKTLLSMAMVSGEDMCARKYRLTSLKQTNDKGTFFTANFELLGRCSDEEYEAAKKWHGMLRAKPVDVDMKADAAEFDK